MLLFDFIVDSGHPSISGHFPGNPIVPGAIIIENVFKAFSRLDNSKEVVSISTVKFIKPVITNQKINVNFRNISAELISFECIFDNVVVVLGRFKIK